MTGQPFKSEVLGLAEKIVDLCSEHTSNVYVAIVATEIVGKVILSQQFAGEHALSAEVPEQLPAAH